jgi:hypothetical protein
VDARCDRLVRCGLLTTPQACTSFFRVPDEDNLYAAIDAGVIDYDPSNAQRCLKALAALPCDTTAREAREPIEACRRMLAGSREVGEECSFDLECASGSCDEPVCPTDTCCTGTCLATRVAAVGAPCTADEECVEGAFCTRQGACTPLATQGQPCRLDANCAPRLLCIGATELEDGACREGPLLGGQCPYMRCAELGARCNAGGVCVPVGMPGAVCASDAECSQFTICGPSNLCIDMPLLGQPCDFRCAGEAWCSMGRCVAPVENTTPCTADNQCASLYCEEGIVFDQCADRPVCF